MTFNKRVSVINVFSLVKKKFKLLLALISSSFFLGYNTLAQYADMMVNDDLSPLYGVDASTDPRAVMKRLAILAGIVLVVITFIIGLIVKIVKKNRRKKREQAEIQK